VPAGTASDFCRTFGFNNKNIQTILQDIYEHKQVVSIDAGKLNVTPFDNADAASSSSLYFVNVASFGMTGKTVYKVAHNWMAKVLTQKYIYLVMGVIVNLTFYCQRCRYTYDDDDDDDDDKEEKKVTEENTFFGAVCNGQYFGGNLRASPHSDPSDGALDFVHVRDVNSIFSRLFQFLPGITHGKLKEKLGERAEHRQIQSLRAEPVKPSDIVYVEADGEAVGKLPASFSVVKNAIKLIRY